MDLRTQSKYKTFFESETYNGEQEPGKTDYKWRFYYLSGINGSQIYPYSETHLAIQIAAREFGRNIIGEKVYKNRPEGWKILQNGDDRMVFTLPNKDLEMAAKLIKARKKTNYSPEYREQLKKRLQGFSGLVKNPT
jgi:hypothetical protein